MCAETSLSDAGHNRNNLQTLRPTHGEALGPGSCVLLLKTSPAKVKATDTRAPGGSNVAASPLDFELSTLYSSRLVPYITCAQVAAAKKRTVSPVHAN